MKLQNNYILLRKDNKEVKSKSKMKANNVDDSTGTIRITVPAQLDDLLNQAFFLKRDMWTVDNIYKLSVSFPLILSGTEHNISFEIFNVIGDCYLNIEVNSKTKNQCVKALEHINSIIYDSTAKIVTNFIIIISYDSVSEYYCNKIFNKFAHFERLFRRLLFNIYVLNYGDDYYKRTIDQSIIDKAKGNIRGKKPKDEQYIKEFFYSLDYSDLQSILFAPKWTSEDEVKKQNFLSKHNDLTSLSDEELRDFINGIQAKSDWERLFEKSIKLLSIQDDIDFIRKRRNDVAHSKFFIYEDYLSSSIILKKLSKEVATAITLTQDIDFRAKNITAIQKSMQGMSIMLNEFSKTLAKSFIPIQMHISEMLSSITENMPNFQKVMQLNLDSIKNAFSSLPKFDNLTSIADDKLQTKENNDDSEDDEKIS